MSAVCLIDGSYHSVDSSDMAFRQAGRIAMSEGMPQCSPVLLEPVMAVEIAVPSEATAKINGIISSRRGQILGFDARPGWPGWDVVEAQIPEAEIQNLIVELRSATAGVGTFNAKFDHLAELTGKIADQVLAGTGLQGGLDGTAVCGGSCRSGLRPARRLCRLFLLTTVDFRGCSHDDLSAA